MAMPATSKWVAYKYLALLVRDWCSTGVYGDAASVATTNLTPKGQNSRVRTPGNSIRGREWNRKTGKRPEDTGRRQPVRQELLDQYEKEALFFRLDRVAFSPPSKAHATVCIQPRDKTEAHTHSWLGRQFTSPGRDHRLRPRTDP